MRHLVSSCITIFILVTSAYAEEPRTVAVYKKHMRSSDHNKGNFDHLMHHMLYLSGVADAYKVMNDRRTAAERQPLYCQPDDVTLNGNDYIRMFELGLYDSANPLPDHLTVAEALLLVLQEEFPCN